MKTLLKNQWKIFLNTAKSQPSKNYLSYFILFIVFCFLLYWLSEGIWAIGNSITEPILAGILSYGFILVIGFIILLGLPQVFKQLYAATDLNLLFTMPIPTKYIFWVKYLQSFAGIPLLIFVLFIVPLYVYGIFIKANLLYYPVVLLTLIAVIVIGLSITYLFNLILVQIIPAGRANEFMTVMSVLSGIFVYILFMLPNTANERPFSEIILSGLPLFPEWIPVTWASDAIVGASTGSIGFLVPFLMILILAAVFMLLTSTLVEKGFRTGWIKLSEGSGKKRKKRTAKKSRSKLHHPVIAVGKKEWYSVKRDMREWLLFMPVLFFIFGFVFSSLMSGGFELSDLRGPNEVTWPISQALLLFVYAITSSHFASSTIGREANFVWLLRILPLSGKDIALGKLWISWLIPFVILTLIEIIIGIFFGWTALPFVGGIAMKAVVTLGITAIGMWFGTIGAKYNPDNPQNRLKFGAGLLLFISSYVYLFLTLIPYALLLIPVDATSFLQDASNNIDGFFGTVAGAIHTVLVWKESSPILVTITGITLMLLISLGIACIFTLLSARRIDKGLEIEMERSTRSKPLFGRKSGSLY